MRRRLDRLFFSGENEEQIEILVHNPHSFGNETAIDEMLSSIALWTGIEFEKDVLSSGEPQKNVGMLLMLVSLVFLGIALFSGLIHIKSNRIIGLFGQDITVKALTGNGHDATAENSVVFTDKDSPSGYIFSGNFPIPDEDGTINKTLSGTSEFTIAAWVNLADTGSHNIIFAKGDTQVAVKTNNSGDLQFYVYSGGWVSVATSVPAKQWLFLTAVRDSAGLKLYVDGVLVAQRDHTSEVNSNKFAPGVGIDQQQGRTLRGLLAGIQIYSRALDASEVLALDPNAVLDGAIVAYDFSSSEP